MVFFPMLRIAQRTCVARMTAHRLVLPDLQNLHSRHSGVYSGITWSPGFTEVTLGRCAHSNDKGRRD